MTSRHSSKPSESFVIFKASQESEDEQTERRWEEMERKKFLYLFLLGVLILVSSSCHPRHVSDIKPNMTREGGDLFGGKHLYHP